MIDAETREAMIAQSNPMILVVDNGFGGQERVEFPELAELVVDKAIRVLLERYDVSPKVVTDG